MSKPNRTPHTALSVETSDYADADGNTLTLRCTLSRGTIRKLQQAHGREAATIDDVWSRREELLFERLAVSWEIAGLPLTDQAMLLGRYRMADADTRRWVQVTVDAHVDRHLPELSAAR